MLKFKNVLLRDGTLTVSGPFTGEAGARVVRLGFAVSQPDVMVEGEGGVTGRGWTGNARAGELGGGMAFAVGVATLVTGDSPPSFQTFTWTEQVEVQEEQG